MPNIKFLCAEDRQVVEMDEVEYLNSPDPHATHRKIWATRPTEIVTEVIPTIATNGEVHIEPVQLAEPPTIANHVPSLIEDVKLVKDVMTALNSVVFERQDVIRALFLCIIAKQHIIMYGLPGTGKNHLVEKFSQVIQHNYWEYQISQNTVLEELYGAWDLVNMRDTGRMQRNTKGTLLEAEIAFLDEIGNSSSPIRNALKWLMNEHKYRDGDAVRIAPIQTIVSASNSMLDIEDATEAAFEDRYLARVRIPDDFLYDESQRSMLMMRNKKTQLPTIPHEVIERLQAAVREIEMTEEFANQAIALRRQISEDSAAGNLNVSPRRFNQTMELAAANAVLSGRTKLRRNDLIVCGLTFWKNIDDAERLQDFLKMHLTTNLAKVELFGQQIEDMYSAWTQSLDVTESDTDRMQSAVLTQAKLLQMNANLKNLRRTSEDQDEIDAIEKIEKTIAEYTGAIAQKTLDFDNGEYDSLDALKKAR